MGGSTAMRGAAKTLGLDQVGQARKSFQSDAVFDSHQVHQHEEFRNRGSVKLGGEIVDPIVVGDVTQRPHIDEMLAVGLLQFPFKFDHCLGAPNFRIRTVANIGERTGGNL